MKVEGETDAVGQEYRIVAVCLGNICRSPMVEAVLRTQLARAGLDDWVSVESAGTGDWHIGKDADPRTRAALESRGYLLNHSARQIDASWFDNFELILALDRANLNDLREMAGDDDDHVEKVRLFRSFDPVLMHLSEEDPQLDVPDPYWSDSKEFHEVLDLVEHACDGVVDYVRLELAN